MDASIISALAALCGTAAGSLISLLANRLNQKYQLRVQWDHHEQSHRQVLYRDFIEEASKCYIDALQNNHADVPALVGLYAKLSRMRVISSRDVVEQSEIITRKILDTYLEPDRTFIELHDMAKSGGIDLLSDFGSACRREFEKILADRYRSA